MNKLDEKRKETAMLDVQHVFSDVLFVISSLEGMMEARGIKL